MLPFSWNELDYENQSDKYECFYALYFCSVFIFSQRKDLLKNCLHWLCQKFLIKLLFEVSLKHKWKPHNHLWQDDCLFFFPKEKYHKSDFYQGYHIPDDQKEKWFHSIWREGVEKKREIQSSMAACEWWKAWDVWGWRPCLSNARTDTGVTVSERGAWAAAAVASRLRCASADCKSCYHYINTLSSSLWV